MKKTSERLKQIVLPLAVFAGVGLLHFMWRYFFPEQNPAQSRWAGVIQASFPWKRYFESQDYLLGYSYALALSFAVAAFQNYRKKRVNMAGYMAVGGLTFSGLLAIAGCFLLGCCGSPMLGVYISLFGAGFLPFAKSLVAVFTTVSILISWWWMKRSMYGINQAGAGGNKPLSIMMGSSGASGICTNASMPADC